MRPRVDVGVVTWNTAELTVSALRHLLEDDEGCDLRLLVHDNASSDETVEALAEHVPEAEVEVGDENLGFARGMNRLLSRSDAPWFLALNSDAWPEPGAIGEMVQAGTRYPRAAAVAPLLLRPDGGVEHSTHAFPSLIVSALDAAGGRRWLPKKTLDRFCLEGGWAHDRPRRVDWAVGAALLMRREAIDELGGFDERFFMYVEDLEWCWRARSAGWEVRFEPNAVIRHVGNASGEKRWGSKRTALEVANLRTFLPEMMGPRRAALYRGLQALACAEQIAVASWRNRPEDAGHWRLQLKALLGLEDPPLLRIPPKDEGLTGRATDGARVAVVVPTCGRAALLNRLFGALEAQTLDPEVFEVVVVDDGSPDDTPQVLEKMSHTTTLNLRVISNGVRRGPAAARNLGWRATSAPVIAFTDDDCVPDIDWLSSGLSALGQEARVVVGRTTAPPEQLDRLGEPFARFVEVDSARFLETCNVFYRKCDLEAVGGFDERFRRPSGEDTRLGLEVTALGVEPVFSPEALVHHDVRSGNLREALLEATRWVDLPLVLRGHAGARGPLAHRWIFWKDTHPPAIAAAFGIIIGIRWRPALLFTLPWLYKRLRVDPACDDVLRRLQVLPGTLALDLCEVATMARGSWRHRTILL